VNDSISIEDIQPGERLRCLQELPPGGIYWALCNVQDGYDSNEAMRSLLVAVRSLSRIECETTCEETRSEARETLEAILDEVVDHLSRSYPFADCLTVLAGRQLQMDITALGGGPEDGGFDPELCGFGDC
tara:strand:+ start:4286 stop:4675 length:390 start_codon:yes stop_codon:yes gene_type:complete